VGCAAVRYTLDDTPPTQGSTVYTAPIPIGSATTIRFFAVDRAGNEERPHLAAYAVPAPVDTCLLVDDMDVAKPHEAAPHGLTGVDWVTGPRVNLDTHGVPTSALGGGVLFNAADVDPSKPTNAKVEIRNARLWALVELAGPTSLGWTALTAGVAWAQYNLEDFSGTRGIVPAIAADGSLRIGLPTDSVAGKFYNAEFWTRLEAIDAAAGPRVHGLAFVYEARLVLADPSLPDDLDAVRILGNAHGDYYDCVVANETCQVPAPPLRDWNIGRLKLLGRAWRRISVTNLQLADLLAYPVPALFP